MEKKTQHCAVFGKPISHSLSPLLHNALYKKENIDAEMKAYECASVKEVIKIIWETPIALSAITLPHKETIQAHLDAIDPVAQKIGAINTVVNNSQFLTGYNTDVIGIAEALKETKLRGKNVLVLGAGGATRPAAFHLQEQGANIFYMNRTPDKAAKIAADFGGTVILEAQQTEHAWDVIINCTPVGMTPHTDASPIDAAIINQNSTVFDLIYTPLETKLLREANAKGARTISGVTMFIAQALAQERYWRGQEFPDRGYSELITNTLST